MRIPGRPAATPVKVSFAFLTAVVLSSAALSASSASAWNMHSSLSNATAPLFEQSHSFRVYLMPDEILDCILLPGYNCSMVDDQAYIRAIQGADRSQGTLLQWSRKAPPEKSEFTLRLNCAKIASAANSNNLSAAAAAAAAGSSPISAAEMSVVHRIVRDIDVPITTEPLNNPELIEKHGITASRTTTTSVNGNMNASRDEHNSPAPHAVVVDPRLESTHAATTQTMPSDSVATLLHAAAPTTEASSAARTSATATSTSDSEKIDAPIRSAQIDPSMSPSANSDTAIESVGLQPAAGEQSLDEAASTSATSTSDSNNSKLEFSLVITRVSMDFVHGQKLSSLDDALNITGELEAAASNGITLPETVLKDASNASIEGQPCLILPKEVRVVEAQYVLFSVGLNSTSGELIRAGQMLRNCGYEDWRPAKEFLAEPAHIRLLDAKLFQLQVLSICLAAAVIVFALLVVFLCTKWRLAVRGSRREASAEFFIKTFHTKERQYAANGDDFYGFPTIRQDSTFYRSPNNLNNATPNSTGGSSFVNGAFHDGEDHQHLPAPPPELRTCIINDENFTEVPLHNLGSDSLRAHRGAHRHQSPPPPPLRTVSSGYMSGQSTPAVEYQNPHEVMILPPIPKEDYSDSDSESSPVSLKTEDGTERAVERKGRFTVRTAL